MFFFSQNVINGTDKVRSQGTVKIAALRCFFLEGTAFRCFILEPVLDVPLVRLWGSIGTRISIWGTMNAKGLGEPKLGSEVV